MRLLIQRVQEARVEVNHEVVGQINRGLLVLIGVEEADELLDSQYLANKLMGLRIFGDDEGKMNLNINQVGGAVLCVSQFTLFASTKKGHRPSFVKAAEPTKAKSLYDKFVQNLQDLGVRVQTGVFGAHMHIHLINDGPVTLLIDSKNPE